MYVCEVLCYVIIFIWSAIAISPAVHLSSAEAGSSLDKYREKRVKLCFKNNEHLLSALLTNHRLIGVKNFAVDVNTFKIALNFNYSEDVGFYLFQRKNQEVQVVEIPWEAEQIRDAGFKKFLPTKVLIHGYSNDINSDVIQLMARNFTMDFNYNVIAVDWSKIAYSFYAVARNHVEGVGEYVGEFLSVMFKASLINPSNVHLIGHSLGAHVAGYAGKTVQKEKWTISRVTGLDPAGPLFNNDPTQRLTKSDAQVVDVIHTCMKYLGITGNIGHIDFYPNGGMPMQPGCDWDLLGICSHGRAYEFFIESIKHRNSFVGHYCADENLSDCDDGVTATMGEWLNYKKEGAYYLKTASSPPFGLGGS